MKILLQKEGGDETHNDRKKRWIPDFSGMTYRGTGMTYREIGI